MLGGGVMGSGIVNLLLKGGFETVLWDINQEALDKGIASIRENLRLSHQAEKNDPG